MAEEEKKQEEKQVGEEKKPEEAKKAEEEKKEEAKTEEKKAEEAAPPQEIVLRVFMHCEGCARKVRRCLKGFEGVEDVQTDCKAHKVVVKGEKADPLKVLERIQRKSHRQVELLSPIPKPKEEEPKKAEEKEPPKTEEKKEEVITVVLKVHMHCEACAQEIKKRIQKMKGVENAEPDLKGSQVTVKGAFEPEKLVEHVYKRTGKRAVIVKVDPTKKEEAKGEEGKEEKKAEDGGEKEKKSEEESKDKKQDGTAAAPAGGGEAAAKGAEEGGDQEEPKLELKKNEFYYPYPLNFQVDPQRFAQEFYYAYPDTAAPQIFSDENPNACSVM